MNAQIKKMQEEIAFLKCDKFIGKSDEELEKLAEEYAQKNQADDIPILDRNNIEKLAEQESQRFYWHVPYSGNALYFQMGPSHYTLGQYVEEIGTKYLRILVESRGEDMPTAEKAIESRLDLIEETLKKIAQDAEQQFSKETIKKSALYIIKKRFEDCSKLNQPGYKIV